MRWQLIPPIFLLQLLQVVLNFLAFDHIILVIFLKGTESHIIEIWNNILSITPYLRNNIFIQYFLPLIRTLNSRDEVQILILLVLSQLILNRA